ncbi:MAG TPA: hypothetical protein PL045_00120 [Chitinophagaceae bacterium]|nr:hypothetical protein [Chitinophagaceae bacterium]
MTHNHFKAAVKFLSLAAFYIAVFSFSAKAGGEGYSIYLNGKLMLFQNLAKPEANLTQLQFAKANYNDELVVYYYHCGQNGKGRSIALKDDKGKILKEWKFTDGAGNTAPMKIAVKELMDLQKKNPNASLALYYSSSQLPNGRMLAGLKPADKNTAMKKAGSNKQHLQNV